MQYSWIAVFVHPFPVFVIALSGIQGVENSEQVNKQIKDAGEIIHIFIYCF